MDIENINPSNINGLNLYSYGYMSSNAGIISSVDKYVGIRNVVSSSSSWFTSLPAVPNAFKHISNINDVFSSVSHSIIVGIYLSKNLDFLNEMRLLGVNSSKSLSYLPKASWINKVGYVISAVDAGVTIYDNLQRGNSLGQALLDGTLSFGISAASAWAGGFVGANVSGMIGAVLGSIIPIPGVGSFIGFAIGTVVGIGVSWTFEYLLNIAKNSLLDWLFD